MSSPEFDFETRQIHAGDQLDMQFGSRVAPVYQSSGYVFDSFDDGAARFDGTVQAPVYSRTDNPTNAAVARRLADLDGGAGALLVSSGTAAIAVALTSLAASGDRIVATSSLYEGTKVLFRNSFARQGITVDFIAADASDAEWRAAFTPRTKAVFTETIPNPKNDVVDLERVATFAHAAGVPLVVDSTVSTPFLNRPIEFGADIVVHSTSKWLSGHGAVIGGVVIDAGTFDWTAEAAAFPQIARPSSTGVASFVERFGPLAYLAYVKTVTVLESGPTFPATSAFALLQGIETLSLRMERHVSNALALAQWLEHEDAVASVDYAGLVSSPYYARAQKYLPEGAGAVVSFDLVGGVDAARAFIDSLELISPMSHLGDVRTLAIHPASTIHAHLTEAQRLAIGITPGLVRISVGLESVRDLRHDLERGLAAASVAAAQAADVVAVADADAVPVGRAAADAAAA